VWSMAYCLMLWSRLDDKKFDSLDLLYLSLTFGEDMLLSRLESRLDLDILVWIRCCLTDGTLLRVVLRVTWRSTGISSWSVTMYSRSVRHRCVSGDTRILERSSASARLADESLHGSRRTDCGDQSVIVYHSHLIRLPIQLSFQLRSIGRSHHSSVLLTHSLMALNPPIVSVDARLPSRLPSRTTTRIRFCF